MKIAVVGATGLVGRTMLEVLSNSKLPVTELIPVASERSAGTSVNFRGRSWNVITIDEAIAKKPAVALFSAGGKLSLERAGDFADAGCRVIDNSSAWRMMDGIPLVVPEINADTIKQSDFIIANPNCSTIQLVMVLLPIHQHYTLKRVVVSTYQAVTGTGMKAIEQLEAERQGKDVQRVYAHPIDLNCIPQCDVFDGNAYTKEELKVKNESRKILRIPDLRITATAVRVPVTGGHSESVNIETVKPFEMGDLRTHLAAMPGVVVQDNPAESLYPMPLTAKGKNEVFVGRIRRDDSAENALNLWIVSDNLRKGAATNTVQIAEYLFDKGWIS
jgi:aspartate-semialdehyde dehydrogenase